VKNTATTGRNVSIWCSVTFFKLLLCEVQMHLELSISVVTHAFRRISRHHACPECIGVLQCHDIVCLWHPCQTVSWCGPVVLTCIYLHWTSYYTCTVLTHYDVTKGEKMAFYSEKHKKQKNTPSWENHF
jgi:hypothetical protein